MTSRPDLVLPDGVERATFGDRSVRKGTVAAFVANARRFGAELPPAERDELHAALADAAPDLAAIGVLDVFEVRDPDLRRLVARALAPSERLGS